ncbi:MAG: helix-turn-helix domain-containing protein [Eubacteriales bacterium]|nr:helix-turn-helix domain-containing protein [Eubacteriales bacterium]
MLNENIRAVRNSKGLSQEELAVKLNVVRQTVSKWERGLSVPDSEMLISISQALATPVSVLLGETVSGEAPDDLRTISEKLEVINLQLAQRQAARRKALHTAFILLCLAIAAVFIALARLGSPYLNWDYSDPERAVAGTLMHAFEFIFVRIAPFAFIGAAAGAVMTRKRD